jgi:mRNA interferase HigB
MRIIAKKTLRDFWAAEPSSEGPLKAWFSEAKNAKWKTPADVKAKYGSESILGNGRAVFNIAGNKYRLVVWINYGCQIVYIRFIGTHKAYDAINVEVV